MVADKQKNRQKKAKLTDKCKLKFSKNICTAQRISLAEFTAHAHSLLSSNSATFFHHLCQEGYVLDNLIHHKTDILDAYF